MPQFLCFKSGKLITYTLEFPQDEASGLNLKAQNGFALPDLLLNSHTSLPSEHILNESLTRKPSIQSLLLGHLAQDGKLQNSSCRKD